MNNFAVLKAVILLVLISGCSSSVLVSDKGLDPSKRSPEGQWYYLPKAMLRVAYMPPEPGKQAIFSVSRVLVKDERHAFRLSYKQNAAADDDITWKIGADGLLSEIGSKTTDKSADIILKVADIAVEGLKAVTLFPAGTVVGKKGPKEEEETATYFDLLLDPESLADPQSPVHAALKADSGDLGLQIQATKPEVNLSAGISGEESGEGFYYREMKPWKFRVSYRVTTKKENVKTKNNFVQDFMFDIPNGSEVVFFGIKRRAFVEASTTVMFTNGIPTEVKIKKPSEVLAGADVPFKLINKFISIPTSIAQFKVSYSSENKKLYDALKAEGVAKDAYIEYLTKKNASSSAK